MTETTYGVFLIDGLRRLLVCHATNSTWKKWSIPKGLAEKNETPFVSATRELREETGVALEKLHVVLAKPLSPVKYKGRNKVLAAFVVHVSDDLTSFPFSCSSLVDRKFPEVDAWKLIELSKAELYLIESQARLMEEILQILDQ